VEVSINYRVSGDVHECWVAGGNRTTYTSTSHNTATKHGLSLVVATGNPIGAIVAPKMNSWYCLPVTSATYAVLDSI
jgi:hypothetical protein